MKRITPYIKFVTSFKILVFILLTSSQVPAQQGDGARARFIEQKFGSQDAAKNAICETQASMGEAMASRYKALKAESGAARTQFENAVLGAQRYPNDSLRTENLKVGLQLLYKGVAAKKIVTAMLDHCLQHDMVYVENIDQSKAKVKATFLMASKREKANCAEKVQALSQAVMAHEMRRPEKDIRKSLAVIGDKPIEEKLYSALVNSDEKFSELFNSFEKECGLTDLEKQQQRSAEFKSACHVNLESLWEIGDAYFENGDMGQATRAVKAHVKDDKRSEAILASLKKSEDDYFEMIEGIQDGC